MADQQHTKLIQRNKALLVSKVDLISTLVLDQLVAMDVLSQEKLTAIKESHAQSNLQLSRAVLEHLYIRPNTDWQKFLACLYDSGQGHIVECLRTTNRDGTAPRFKTSQTTLTMKEGDPCRIELELSGDPMPLVACFKDHQPVLDTSVLKLTSGENKCVLENDKCSIDMDGTVKVIAINDHGTAECTISLTVEKVRQSESSAVRLQQKMADIILQLYDKIPMWTLHSDLCMEPMDHLFVDLVLVKDKQRTLEKQECLQGYKDIFRKSRKRSTIYLSGEPGVGKSTFTKHLCVEWAKIHDETVKTRKQTADTCDNYQFLLPLFLRDIKKGQSLCELFAVEYQLRAMEAEELYHQISSTEQPVLIIADGLDEYSECTSEDVTKLLHRQILPNITLLITSRFSPDSYSAKTNLRLDTVVALRGFSDAGVKEYLLKFFNKDQEKRDALFAEIIKSEDLVYLSHCPAMLLMIATLGQQKQQLPSTITGFYEEIVAYVFARIEKKLKPLTDRAKSTKEILKRYNKQIMALGRLATGNLKTHKLELIFKVEDVVKHISSDDLKIGFLIEKQTFSREIFYMFIHKTLQEFFLAFFLVYSDESTQKELLVRFFNSRLAFTESAMMRRFVAGLGGQELQKRLERSIEGSEEEVAESHTDLQLEYLAEHKDATLLLPRVTRLEITERYPVSHFVRYLSQDAGEVKKMRMVAYPKAWRLLQHLHAPQLTCLELNCKRRFGWIPVEKQYITQALDKTLTKFPLEQLKVQGIFRKHPLIFPPSRGRVGVNLPEVVSAVAHIKTLKEIEFERLQLTHDNVQKWLPGMNLTKLKMSFCNLFSDYIQAFSVIPPSLHTLDLRGNIFRSLTDTGKLSGVTCSSIQTLDMSNCELTAHGMLAVIDAAPQTLTYLNLSENWLPPWSDDLVGVAEKTTRLSKLKTLKLQTINISNATLTPRDVLTIIDVAPETLTDLDVSHNGSWWTGGNDLLKVTERTTHLYKLKTLNLQHNYISEDVVKKIERRLSEACPHLKLMI